MPQAPNVDGLPVWLQIVVTLIFGLATLIVGLRGYSGSRKVTGGSDTPQIAHLADMSAVRHLADQIHVLNATMIGSERAVTDLTHFVRQQTDLERELCQRLRELKEELARGSVRGRDL